VTFAQLKEAVLAEAFPLGVPENLTLDGYVVSALIEVQRWIKCYRYRHDDVFPACNTFWHCGTTVITAPRGRILRAYTVDRGESGTEWCYPVVLAPVDMAELRRWQAKFRGHWSADFYQAPGSGKELPQGFDVPTTSSDAVSGRALTGVYALDAAACRIYVAPWIQTTESLVIEWQGIKRNWSDADLVPSDPDFIRLLRLFVDLEYGRKWGCSDLAIRERAWAEALADQVVTCEEESKLHGEPGSAAEASIAAYAPYVAETDAEVEEDEDEVTITFVGDFGDAGTDAEAVADAVVEDNSDGWVISLGDSKYPPNDGRTGLAPYEHFVLRGRLRAALGDIDLNDGNLGADITTYVGNPGNRRYFGLKIGPVSVFVLNSGLNSSGVLVETDGNYPGSRQWQEVSAAILRDTSPWKIVVIHHPPYTSGATYYPGESMIRWVSDLPVHAIISGHSRNYERLVVRDRLHIVAGTGGLPLHDFNETAIPGSQEQIADFGFLRMSATCDAATLEFVDVAGEVLDTVELDATIVSAPTSSTEDPRITTNPEAVEIDEFSEASFSVVADGTAPFSYQWRFNGVAILGATESTYTIPSARLSDAGQYSVIVTNSVGAVLSVAVELTVNALDADERLLHWVRTSDYDMTDRVPDDDNILLTATIEWPDGTTGTYTRTAKHPTYNLEDGYTMSHASGTVTQAAYTWDDRGNVTYKPPLTFTPA